MKVPFNFSKSIAIFLAVIILFSSCVSTTKIDTIPTGANLYINEMYAGTTPYFYSDTKIVGSTTRLRFEKEGFEVLNAYLTRDEDVDVGAIVAGVFVWVPFLWTLKYVPFHNYSLVPLQNYISTDTVPAVPSISTEKSKTNEEKLQELKLLYEKNLITIEEYQTARKKILENL